MFPYFAAKPADSLKRLPAWRRIARPITAAVLAVGFAGTGPVAADDVWQGLREALPAMPPPTAPAVASPPADNVAAMPPPSDGEAGPSLDEIITGAILSDPPTPGTAAAAPPQDTPAPSRIARPPDYSAPAAAGAGTGGFDSLSRARPPRPLPGTATPAGRAAAPARGNRVRVPISASVAGTAEGQPPRRPLRPDPEPFAATGLYVGTFLAKVAVELSGGYSSNPGRFFSPRGSAFYLIAPELLVTSNWSRHELIADLRGSFTGYGTTFPPGSGTPGPTVLDRPEFTGRVAGRFDVTRDTRLIGEWRSRIGTDNPGSPNIEAGLAEYPLYVSNGASAGFEQDFNRLRLAASATVDRTEYRPSTLTDGTVSDNADRNLTRYGGVGRASYELRPGFRPFVEVQGDSRVHDRRTDRYGFRRDSSGGSVSVGSTFELTRLITGEAAVGYLTRRYDDPRLRRIEGLLTSGSLVWTPTGLTTVRLTATSSVDETTLAGSSGAISRGYAVQVDHDFRRWLTGTLRFAYGSVDYDGADRSDRSYSVGGDLVYRMSRTVHVKAAVRHEWLHSNAPGVSAEETVVTLGVRLQR